MAKGNAKPKQQKQRKRPPDFLPRKLDYTSSFSKSWEKYNKTGEVDLSQVRDVCKYFVSREPLPAHYKDHELKGNKWKEHRELHLDGDLLLVYKRYDDKNLVVLVELGTHAELF